MSQSRYVQIPAIKTHDNQLVPLWDPRVKFVKSDYFGDHFTIDGGPNDHHEAIDCMFDVKEKKLLFGVEIDIYPNHEKLTYKKGMDVLQEAKHRILRKNTIVDIISDEFEVTIKKGKKFDKYETEAFKDKIEFDPETIYAIKRWKPCYIMADGSKVRYEHELYLMEG